MRKLMIGMGLMALLLGGVAAPSAAAAPSDVGVLRVVTIGAKQLPTSNYFIPPRVSGDADFNGNGPDVFASTRLFGVGTRTLRVQIFMDATETVSDFTRARGLSSMMTIFEANAGECVVSVNRGQYDEVTYRDTDHDQDFFTGQVTGSFVSGWFIIGDTTGNEAGTETGAIIQTNSMTADVQPC
jgi:hypothetical protein